MTNNQLPKNTNYQDRKMIDFLEDSDFREWILHPEKNQQHNTDWDTITHRNKAAREARYILVSLKSYFEQHHFSEAEIQVRLEQEIQKYRSQHVFTRQRRAAIYWLGRAAAAVLLLIGLFFLVRWMNRPLEVYTTGFGEQLTIELPDASIIRLNSNSTLTWNRSWEKDHERKVELDGEAFFSVEHIDDMPFQVHTNDITVNVTGTQFNINSRRQKTMVYLEEGKVNVAVKEQPEKKYEMEPGEELVYMASSKKIEMKKVEESEEISAWKEGLLVFREEPLMKVLESVSDIYGKEFVTKDSALLHRNITTTIPLTNWEVSLTAIQLAMRLEVEEENDTVRISPAQTGRLGGG